MAYQLSPGVLVTEQDLTTVVPTVSTTPGGFVGNFEWGPAQTITFIDSENNLVANFGAPNSNTYLDFFTAANFLAYGNQLLVVRAVNESKVKNAIATGNLKFISDESNTNVIANCSPNAEVILNIIDYEQSPYISDTYNIADPANVSITAYSTVMFTAKYPGARGNSLKVVLIDNHNWGNTESSFTSLFNDKPNVSKYVSNFGGKNDELHAVIVDEDGLITGTKNTVLETFPYMSKCATAKLDDGTSIYYKNVLNDSKYVWWRSHPQDLTSGNLVNWGSENPSTDFDNIPTAGNSCVVSFTGGADSAVTDGNLKTGYDLFLNTDEVDVSLLPAGAHSSDVVKYMIESLAEVRKDCMVFVSPKYADMKANITQPVTNIINYRTNSTGINAISSSYAVMDSGWKYQYDRYNDVYRWLPLNADIAGLVVRADLTNDPWYSPAGLNRGQIKNVIRLAYNPSQSDRDLLYKNGINPVISRPGTGTILYGDKTLLSRPSAFDRINVRRLFIVLEKAIALASRYSLFEFNDGFTRAQFKNLVEPFLRDVQGRRGITDFQVICDETNNTGEVIDRNEFVADIYIKPTRSINFIKLNFIATRTGISFSEVGA